MGFATLFRQEGIRARCRDVLTCTVHLDVNVKETFTGASLGKD